MLVENKVIIVTGAASPRGIGKATRGRWRTRARMS